MTDSRTFKFDGPTDSRVDKLIADHEGWTWSTIEDGDMTLEFSTESEAHEFYELFGKASSIDVTPLLALYEFKQRPDFKGLDAVYCEYSVDGSTVDIYFEIMDEAGAIIGEQVEAERRQHNRKASKSSESRTQRSRWNFRELHNQLYMFQHTCKRWSLYASAQGEDLPDLHEELSRLNVEFQRELLPSQVDDASIDEYVLDYTEPDGWLINVLCIEYPERRAYYFITNHEFTVDSWKSVIEHAREEYEAEGITEFLR